MHLFKSNYLFNLNKRKIINIARILIFRLEKNIFCNRYKYSKSLDLSTIRYLKQYIYVYTIGNY